MKQISFSQKNTQQTTHLKERKQERGGREDVKGMEKKMEKKR
jgi:hypothetical protein